jgi:hypothetical protein
MNQTTHKCKNCGEEWSPIPHTDSADVCPNCGQPTNDKTPEKAEQLAIGVVKDFRRKRIMSYDHDKPDAIRAILSAIQSATQPLERRIGELEKACVVWHLGTPEVPECGARRFLVSWRSKNGKFGTTLAEYMNKHRVQACEDYEPTDGDGYCVDDETIELSGWHKECEDRYGDGFYLPLEFTPEAWAELPLYQAIDQTDKR